MSKLSKKQILNALQALLSAYKDILREWLRDNNKKGVKYTKRMRRDTVMGGYTYLGEREFCEPMTIKRDGELVIDKDTLPWLTFKKMNEIFKEKGYETPPWEYLSRNYNAYDRAVHLFDLTYKSGYKL